MDFVVFIFLLAFVAVVAVSLLHRSRTRVWGLLAVLVSCGSALLVYYNIRYFMNMNFVVLLSVLIAVLVLMVYFLMLVVERRTRPAHEEVDEQIIGAGLPKEILSQKNTRNSLAKLKPLHIKVPHENEESRTVKPAVQIQDVKSADKKTADETHKKAKKKRTKSYSVGEVSLQTVKLPDKAARQQPPKSRVMIKPVPAKHPDHMPPDEERVIAVQPDGERVMHAQPVAENVRTEPADVIENVQQDAVMTEKDAQDTRMDIAAGAAAVPVRDADVQDQADTQDQKDTQDQANTADKQDQKRQQDMTELTQMVGEGQYLLAQKMVFSILGAGYTLSQQDKQRLMLIMKLLREKS